ncbi:hypothetical protein [Rhodococcoides fascians]|uniref:hypothetical protein n=1 Tax=Rhodococcoides fascians TaxID=1828 RepID=UPI0012D2AE5C|nr:hypothetical protein [Rhodococcus fascians]
MRIRTTCGPPLRAEIIAQTVHTIALSELLRPDGRPVDVAGDHTGQVRTHRARGI